MTLLKQYGPVIGLLVGFIIWQAHWISKLLDRHEKAYSGEIERMHEHMKKLLEHVLGPQPSSGEAPNVKDMVKGTANSQKQLPEPPSIGDTEDGTK